MSDGLRSTSLPLGSVPFTGGTSTGDARRDALVRFVRRLARTSGTVSESEFEAIKAAGYSDAQLVDISLAFATTVFTNVFNRINDTDIDFPAVA